MSGSPLIEATDGDAAWRRLRAPAGLAAPRQQDRPARQDRPAQQDGPARQGEPDGPAGFPRIASCLPARDLTAVRAVREFTRATLRYWEVTGRCDDITLVLSELVTNALQ